MVGSIFAFLRDKTRDTGGRVYVAPLDVRFNDENNTQPDVLLITAGRTHLIGDKRIEGAPDLVVKVISPGSVRMDRVVKFRLYERFGVREYWLIDPEGVAEVFALRDGRFVLIGMFGAGEIFDSPLLGQPVPLAGLFD